MYLSVIIPAYNEERHIQDTIRSVYAYLTTKPIDAEVIVVVDGARDATAQRAQALISEVPILRVIDRKENKGKGFSVREGMLAASGAFRVFMDADNSTSIDHLEIMMPYFDQNYDVVIGSIGVRGHKVAAGSEQAWRRVLGKLGNLFIQIMVVPGIFDTQRGFKVIRGEVADRVFPHMTIDKWGFDIELLALARKLKYRIKEVPVDWHNDPQSHVGAGAYKEVLLETVRIRWNLVSGAYHLK